MCLIAAACLNAETVFAPKIQLQIPSGYEGQKLQGTIKILHLKDQAIDNESFQVARSPLQVSLVAQEKPDVRFFGEDREALVVSVYHFPLQAQNRGLYVFGPVSVVVGDIRIRSSAVSYEVVGPQVSQELALQARIIEQGAIYPGQPVTFEYRFYFRKPIQLIREELPLLHLEGFRNVGAPQIATTTSGPNTVQIVTQKAVSEALGTFESGASIIEGYVYSVNTMGEKSFQGPLLHAEAPSISITVAPFPSASKPEFFNGAIGNFLWQVGLKGAKSVDVGEKLTLEIFVSGQGDLDTVQVPDLSRQKEFKDAFVFSDIAPVGKVEDGTKRFIVELRPIDTSVKEIPAILFASFDPLSKSYVIKKSNPIAITVRIGASGTKEAIKQKDEKSPQDVQGIEILANPKLSSDDLETKALPFSLLYYALIAICALLVIEILLSRWIEAEKDKSEKSHSMFLDAIKKRSDPDECLKMLREALLHALQEAGYTKRVVDHHSDLKAEGLEGEIKSLLRSIEQKRFTGLEAQMEINEIINEATQLYYKLRK